MAILNVHKAQLGELLAKGHAKFGMVAARRPYPSDDTSGEGAPPLDIPIHPLLQDVPVGIDPNLTNIPIENSTTNDEVLDRADELTPSLRNQPALQQRLDYQYSNRYIPKPSPY